MTIDWDKAIPDTGDETVNQLLKIAYLDGYREGLKAALSDLEAVYLNPRVKPGSEEALFILGIAKILGEKNRERLSKLDRI